LLSWHCPLIENLPSGIQLIPGDFIEKSKRIPDNSVDLIFTDPLYYAKEIS
jgi:DNA modification methylase